jgi:uncharacterized protein DUF5908
MPIEIKQMYININVSGGKSSGSPQGDDDSDDDKDDAGCDDCGDNNAKKQSGAGMGQSDDIQECVDAVLEILNNKKER